MATSTDDWDLLPISTEGWDTTFALALPRVNAQLQQAIADGSVSLPVLNWVSDDASAVLTDVHFSAWTLSSRGLEQTSGTAVRLQMKIRSGSFVGPGVSLVHLDAVELLATVSLGRLDDAAHSKLVLDKTKALTVDKVLSFGALPGNAEVMFRMAMGAKLNDTLPQFGHVFATVDLQPLAGALPWLQPHKVGYCFAGGQDDASSHFAVLCMTDGFIEGNPLPPASVCDKLVPAGLEGAFVMSKRLFVRHLLLPGVAAGFASAATRADPAALLQFQQSRFELDSTALVVQKKRDTGDLPAPSVAVDLSVLYTLFSLGALGSLPGVGLATLAVLATVLTELIVNGRPNITGDGTVGIERLSVELAQGTIVFKAGMRCDVTTADPLPRIAVATVRFDAQATFRLVMSADGSISFVSAGTTHGDPILDASDWVKNSAEAVKVIAGIVATIATILTEGLASVLIGLEFIAIQTALQMLPQLIQSQVGGAAGSSAPNGLQQLVVAAALPVHWADESFAPIRAKLNDDLGFGGALRIRTGDAARP
jgi:hypothetical protein